MSAAIVTAHFRDKAGIQIRLEGMAQAVPASIYRFDRATIFRDSAGGILARFNVGEAGLERAIRVARGESVDSFPVFSYPGVDFEEAGEVVLFLRPAERDMGIDYVFTAAGAVEDPYRQASLAGLVEANPYDADADPRRAAATKTDAPAAPVRVTSLPELVPLYLQAGVRHFGEPERGPRVDFAMHLDGKLLYSKIVESNPPRSSSGFAPFRISKGPHRLSVVSKSLNKRWEKNFIAMKSTWVVITYDSYGPDHPQRLKEGLTLDIYDHEVYPR